MTEDDNVDSFDEFCRFKWAKPDIEHAASHMRTIYENPELAKEIGNAAQSFMDKHYNFTTIGERYESRIKEIQRLTMMN